MTPPLKIDKHLHERKAELLAYLRGRATEALGEIKKTYGVNEYRERATASNRALMAEKERLVSQMRQEANREHWPTGDLLPNILLISHCTNVVMIESRNSMWPYDYMAFSRRIGELWEPFCNDCFEFPVRKDVSLFVPPLFKDVRKRLAKEIKDFIVSLPISPKQKASLLHYYDQVWSLVTSGEIQLALDLHFAIEKVRYVVDFKSGFGSNEKGNVNRLLLVASVYKNIEPEDYHCLLLCRSAEDENNNYLQTLKNSGLWEVHCGRGAYVKVKEYSGFDIKKWIDNNIAWATDLNKETRTYLQKEKIFKYLTW